MCHEWTAVFEEPEEAHQKEIRKRDAVIEEKDRVIEELKKWAEYHEKMCNEICTPGIRNYEWMPPSENCRGALSVLCRLIKRRGDILYFLRHPQVPYTDNECKRGLRPAKRKTKTDGT